MWGARSERSLKSWKHVDLAHTAFVAFDYIKSSCASARTPHHKRDTTYANERLERVTDTVYTYARCQCATARFRLFIDNIIGLSAMLSARFVFFFFVTRFAG